MKKILIIAAVVIVVAAVGYGAANYLYFSSLQQASDYARQAGAKSMRGRMVNVLAVYYDKYKKLPQNIDEYFAFDSTLAPSSVQPIISYRLIDKNNVELCYLIPVDTDREAPCITYTQP